MHPRLTPFDGTNAHTSLRGKVAAERFTDGDPASIRVEKIAMTRTPGGAIDKEVLFGARVVVLDHGTAFSFVQCVADGYCGYVQAAALGPDHAPAHAVTAPLGSHLYQGPEMKSAALHALSFGSQLTVDGSAPGFVKVQGGWVPSQHVRPLWDVFADPVAVALSFVGVPYLWGGNSSTGMDCSGLVQLAFHACGSACPRDSDMQVADLGTALPADTALQRGDLVFWAGHVGLMVDPKHLVHANAHHMAVTSEPLAEVAARIDAAGEGPITALKRLSESR